LKLLFIIKYIIKNDKHKQKQKQKQKQTKQIKQTKQTRMVNEYKTYLFILICSIIAVFSLTKTTYTYYTPPGTSIVLPNKNGNYEVKCPTIDVNIYSIDNHQENNQQKLYISSASSMLIEYSDKIKYSVNASHNIFIQHIHWLNAGSQVEINILYGVRTVQLLSEAEVETNDSNRFNNLVMNNKVYNYNINSNGNYYLRVYPTDSSKIDNEIEYTIVRKQYRTNDVLPDYLCKKEKGYIFIQDVSKEILLKIDSEDYLTNYDDNRYYIYVVSHATIRSYLCTFFIFWVFYLFLKRI